MRPAFLIALAEGRAGAFCETWLDQLWAAYEDLAWDGRHTSEPDPEIALVNDTRDSLRLLSDWWLPSKRAETSREAAQFLHEWVGGQLFLYAAIALEGAMASKKEQRDARNFEVLKRQILQLQSNEAFLTGVALRLATYDPAESPTSPDAALQAAIQTEIDRNLGPLLRAIRVEVPNRPAINRRSLGDEIRLRLALPERDPVRTQLESALSALPGPQRNCLITIYGEGGYKALQGQGLSGRKIDELRQSAIRALLEQLPDLTHFYLADR